MHVSVAIVGFRNPGDIVRCLESLGRSTHRDFEVVICENGGPASFQALAAATLRQLPAGQSVRLVLAPGNLGYAGGVNLCFRETPESDAWWVLNPDTAVSPDAMAKLVARLEAGDCEAVGHTLQLPNGRVQSHGGHWRGWLARPTSIGHGSELRLDVDPSAIERRQNYLNGASMMISRRFLEVVGPLSEEYFLYCEEVEWCLRGVKRGMRLGFAPGALVLHYQGTTTGNPPDVASRSRLAVYLNERNKILTTRDRYMVYLPVAAAAAFLALFLRYPRRRAWRQLGYGLAGWLAGLWNERGVPEWANP
jgi:N-acetylglucosaminyl-diphospho-decaprenol L-rhamnosyltransferase